MSERTHDEIVDAAKDVQWTPEQIEQFKQGREEERERRLSEEGADEGA